MPNPSWTRRSTARRGAIIVEFALVVPLIMLIVFGVIDFSRAYGQLNALNSALREGSRYASKVKNIQNYSYNTLVKIKVADYASQYGFVGMDTSRVTVTLNVVNSTIEYISVTATAHPIPLQTLGRFLGAPALSVTRSAMFRYECAGMTTTQCF